MTNEHKQKLTFMLTYKKLWLSAATTRKIEKITVLSSSTHHFHQRYDFLSFLDFERKCQKPRKSRTRQSVRNFDAIWVSFFITSRFNFKNGLKTFFIQIKPESLTSWHSFWFRFMRSPRSRLMQLAIWKSPLVMVSFFIP